MCPSRPQPPLLDRPWYFYFSRTLTFLSSEDNLFHRKSYFRSSTLPRWAVSGSEFQSVGKSVGTGRGIFFFTWIFRAVFSITDYRKHYKTVVATFGSVFFCNSVDNNCKYPAETFTEYSIGAFYTAAVRFFKTFCSFSSDL